MAKSQDRRDVRQPDEIPSLNPAKLPQLLHREMVDWERYVSDQLAMLATPREFRIVPLAPSDGLFHQLERMCRSRRPWSHTISCATDGEPIRFRNPRHLSHTYAYCRGSRCGEAIHLLFPFRQPDTRSLAVVAPHAATIFLYPGRYWRHEGTDWVLWNALLAWQLRMRAQGQSQNRPGPKPGRLSLGNTTIAGNTLLGIIGLGLSNPGHLLFQDLLGLMELARRASCRDKRDILVTREGLWISDLVREIFPTHNLVESDVSFSDVAAQLEWSDINLEFPPVKWWWPESRHGDSDTETVIEAFRRIGTKHAAVTGQGPTIFLPSRLESREWAPIGGNIKELAAIMRKTYPEARFIVHLVCDSESPAFKKLAEEMRQIRGVETLVNPSLATLASRIMCADVAIGPIGTGFWWPGMANTPSVTLHPHNMDGHSYLHEWTGFPEHGKKPLFLRMLDDGLWLGIEERGAPRQAFDALDIAPAQVAAAAMKLLDKYANAPRRPGAEMLRSFRNPDRSEEGDSPSSRATTPNQRRNPTQPKVSPWK